MKCTWRTNSQEKSRLDVFISELPTRSKYPWNIQTEYILEFKVWKGINYFFYIYIYKLPWLTFQQKQSITDHKEARKIPFLQGKGTITSPNFSLEGDSLRTGPSSLPAQRSHPAQDWMFLVAHDCHMSDGDGPRPVTCSITQCWWSLRELTKLHCSEMVRPCIPELFESDRYPSVPLGDK